MNEKLTFEDKQLLYKWGHSDKNFFQIERAMQKNITTYTLYPASTKYDFGLISEDKVIELLGRENWLSGISRSAFHCVALRTTIDGDNIVFDSSRLFMGR